MYATYVVSIIKALDQGFTCVFLTINVGEIFSLHSGFIYVFQLEYFSMRSVWQSQKQIKVWLMNNMKLHTLFKILTVALLTALSSIIRSTFSTLNFLNLRLYKSLMYPTVFTCLKNRTILCCNSKGFQAANMEVAINHHLVLMETINLALRKNNFKTILIL